MVLNAQFTENKRLNQTNPARSSTIKSKIAVIDVSADFIVFI
jgi:hypothetical protein